MPKQEEARPLSSEAVTPTAINRINHGPAREYFPLNARLNEADTLSILAMVLS